MRWLALALALLAAACSHPRRALDPATFAAAVTTCGAAGAHLIGRPGDRFVSLPTGPAANRQARCLHDALAGTDVTAIGYAAAR